MDKCEKCGACCKVDERMTSYDRGDGWCVFLTEDNLCRIYEHRPPECNVNEIYKENFDSIDYGDFLKWYKRGCKKLQRRYRK